MTMTFTGVKIVVKVIADDVVVTFRRFRLEYAHFRPWRDSEVIGPISCDARLNTTLA